MMSERERESSSTASQGCVGLPRPSRKQRRPKAGRQAAQSGRESDSLRLRVTCAYQCKNSRSWTIRFRFQFQYVRARPGHRPGAITNQPSATPTMTILPPPPLHLACYLSPSHLLCPRLASCYIPFSLMLSPLRGFVRCFLSLFFCTCSAAGRPRAFGNTVAPF
jgi:hypothetical protein